MSFRSVRAMWCILTGLRDVRPSAGWQQIQNSFVGFEVEEPILVRGSVRECVVVVVGFMVFREF